MIHTTGIQPGGRVALTSAVPQNGWQGVQRWASVAHGVLQLDDDSPEGEDDEIEDDDPYRQVVHYIQIYTEISHIFGVFFGI